MTPAHAPLPTDCSLPFHPADGSHTSILMSESLVGVSVAVTRQKAGRLLSAAGFGTVTGGPPGIVNGPRATAWADVTVVFASVNDSRLSHVAALAAAGAAMVTTAPMAMERIVFRVTAPNCDTSSQPPAPRETERLACLPAGLTASAKGYGE